MTAPSEAPHRLLGWFDRHGRDLPWRRDRDPYRVWVSEVMLQQTRVERVSDFFTVFVKEFPSVEALAGAEIDEVLARWSGLGYYRRARFLHRAAREIVAAGGFPRNSADWRQLPGIGTYTAAAVASIAFGESCAAIDANAERVLARVGAVDEDPRSASGRQRLEAVAQSLLDPERPGDSNQAIMDLGATVCRPRGPRCMDCPLGRDLCAAAAANDAERYPRRHRRPSRRVEEQRLGVLCVREGRILLLRRSDSASLLAGLWDIPWIPWCERSSAETLLASTYGGRWHLGRSCGWVRHAITFRDVRLEVWDGRLEDSEAVADRGEARWHGLAALPTLPLSSLVTKSVAKLDRHARSQHARAERSS